MRHPRQLQTRDPASCAARQFYDLIAFKREIHSMRQKMGRFFLFKAQTRVPQFKQLASRPKPCENQRWINPTREYQV